MTLSLEMKNLNPISSFENEYCLTTEIISLLPKHKVYVEPFGGSGQLVTAKNPSKLEVYNDINGNLVNNLLATRKQGSLTSGTERWRQVMIECVDFRRIFEIYDSSETLFFIDPPMEGKCNFSYKDHVELALILRTIKGKAILTCYESDLMNSLYNGWYRINIKRNESVSYMYEKQNKLILVNYRDEQLSLF